jgi:hypothetical protein
MLLGGSVSALAKKRLLAKVRNDSKIKGNSEAFIIIISHL